MKADNLELHISFISEMSALSGRKTFGNSRNKQKPLPPKILQSIRQYRLLLVLRGMRGRAINDYRCIISIPAKDGLSCDAFMGLRIM